MNERLKLILVLVVTAAITGPLSCCIGWGTARMFPGKPGEGTKDAPSAKKTVTKEAFDQVTGGWQTDVRKDLLQLVGEPDSVDVGGDNRGDIYYYNKRVVNPLTGKVFDKTSVQFVLASVAPNHVYEVVYIDSTGITRNQK